jgi:hypothetical protein
MEAMIKMETSVQIEFSISNIDCREEGKVSIRQLVVKRLKFHNLCI